MSRWDDSEVRRYLEKFAEHGEDLALRTYTTRLLGQDPSLVLHGGGNTSVKTTRHDELGREVDVLCVKGSGWDMGWIEPEGLPAVCLAPIREFRALDGMSDEAMVNGVRRNLLDTSSPTPSVETLLHAFLPHKFIDHTHADAILALADQPDADTLCREIFGDRMGIVPYIMAGFSLAKKAAEVYEKNPSVEGLILIKHGIFTFGDTAREAYERMLDHVGRARDYLRAKSPAHVLLRDAKSVAKPERFASQMAVLRGALGRRTDGIGHVVLQWRRTDQIDTFLRHPNLTELASRGPITPDHVIRTKQKPIVIEPPIEDLEGFAARVHDAIEAYVEAYHDYFETQIREKGVSKKAVHPLPLVCLIPGMGLVTVGKTLKAANIVADIYEHTIDTILAAEHIGTYEPLTDGDLFDMEYWSLEQAKLGKKKDPPLAGRVTLVTGAASGIGAATARRFAASGSNLVLADLDATRLGELGDRLRSEFKIGVLHQAINVTHPEAVAGLVAKACCAFGGVDIVVSNAGTAPNGPMAESTDLLKTSLEVNLLAHQYVASTAAGVFGLQQLGGCLLFNASKSAFNPGPGFGAYAIPKAGLIALMKQYALELADQGVRSMAVNADRIRTGIFDQDLLAARAKARGLTPDDYFKANLLKREVLAEDVAEAFYNLATAEKSTGAVMTVDGGNIAASPR